MNSFLGVGEREKGNIWVNSRFTSFAVVCDVEFSKILDVCEMLGLALSLSVVELNFERFFFPRLFVLALICLFCRDIFPSYFNVADYIVFLIFKLN